MTQCEESSGELGYLEGKNIAYEYRYAEGKRERSALADELVRLKVDVIVAGGGNDTQAAKNATRTIPIVFLESVADPVAVGLVATLARPGETSPGLPPSPRCWLANVWKSSKKPFPSFHAWLSCGIRRLRTTCHSGKKASKWLQDWVCNFIPWCEQPHKYDSAFKEAIKAGSRALAVTRHRLTVSYQKSIIELAAKISCRRFISGKTSSRMAA